MPEKYYRDTEIPAPSMESLPAALVAGIAALCAKDRHLGSKYGSSPDLSRIRIWLRPAWYHIGAVAFTTGDTTAVLSCLPTPSWSQVPLIWRYGL